MANTGVKNVLTLRKYVNGVATSEFKSNVFGDPDYIAPYTDLIDCPVSGTTLPPTTQPPCVSGLDAVVCGYSVGSSEEACDQTNVVIAYKTDLWLNFGTVVYSSADGCSTALGFYAPLPGEEGEGSVFQINQSGDVVASANCDAGNTEPPVVYNVGFITNNGGPIASFGCGTSDQVLYASTPLFTNVNIGTKIYADASGTPLQGGNLWFGIAPTSGSSTRVILIDNTGVVTNEAACAPPEPNTFNVTNNGSGNYIINGQSNPTLTITEGETYTFNINAIGHPFWIKTNTSTGTANQYNDGVTNNGTDNGVISFVVPFTAPSTLYYNCQFHSSMAGVINVIDVPIYYRFENCVTGELVFQTLNTAPTVNGRYTDGASFFVRDNSEPTTQPGTIVTNLTGPIGTGCPSS